MLSVFIDKSLQTTFVAIAYSLKLPFTIMAIQTTELNCCLDREILVQIIASNLCISLGIIDTNIRIAYLTKILAALFRLINGSCEDNLLNLRTNFCQIHIQGLVVSTIAIATGQIITSRLNGSVRCFLVAIENEKILFWYLSVYSQHERRRIQVEIITRSLVWIPAKSYTYKGKPLVHTYALSFFEINHNANNLNIKLAYCKVRNYSQDY